MRNTNLISLIGRSVLALVGQTGRLALFTWQAVTHCFRPPWFPSQIFHELLRIGYLSLPVVGLTAFFTGGVLALQIYEAGSDMGAESFVPQIVAFAITRELGPVLAGLMVAGRVGAAIAAEIGTMRVTEQIDALQTLSTNPFKYLIAPKILGAVISLPFLVLVGDIIGIFGGYLASTQSLGFNGGIYVSTALNFISAYDIQVGLWKAAVFGFIIALMGAYNGYFSRGGAQGVGTATTNAVVTSSIFILAANYLLTSLLFSEGM